MSGRKILNFSKLSDNEIQNIMDELDDDDFNETGDELDSEDDIEEANFTGLCNSFIDECLNSTETLVNAINVTALDNFDTGLETSVATNVPGSSKRRRVSSNKRKIDGKRTFVPTSYGFVGQQNEIKNDSPKFKSMTWKKKRLRLNVKDLAFHGYKETPSELEELKTPFDCFQYF
ncbi:unnamed protein product [Ceratitis capitata]|uniref:(Mediterranean fruit fly) hypothetical protein n=1 Tax=Ceratitis capitata TaxID=7213 RepID=A0A811UIR6_CERCA|nr:unnamed protein product [Ceratitis capitata]